MNIGLLSGNKAMEEILRLINDSTHIDVAVAWAGNKDNEVVEALWKHTEKLRHVVIGTHLYQTDPKVLRRFMKFKQVRYMSPKGNLFHPKVYIFESKNGLAAVVGSHNLTKGAFNVNVEASVMIQGSNSENIFRELDEFIKVAWDGAGPINENFVSYYERRYREAQEDHKKINRPFISSLMKMTWDEYVYSVNDSNDIKERLEILEKAQELFQRSRLFSDMSQEERQSIAGTLRKKQTGLDKLKWEWFGTMYGNGDFAKLVKEKPDGLSSALDQIPIDGPVSKDNYDKFAISFNEAFKSTQHHGGVPTASRLLAMKRPDTFVCINSANKKALCDNLKVSSSKLNVDNYWSLIVERIKESGWWGDGKPQQKESARIWDNRAALLDCIYYKQKPN